MKRTISLTIFPMGISSDPKSEITQVPRELFDRIVSIYPEGRQRRSFSMTLPIDDDRTIAVRQGLKGAGFIERGSKFGPSGGHYVAVKFVDEYEASDFGHHEWYEVYPSLSGADYVSRDERGRIRNLGERDYTLSQEENAALLAREEDARGKIPMRLYDSIASVPPFALIMGKNAVDAAESAGFHISLKPTTVLNILELTTDVMFPVLSGVCDFRDPKGLPIPFDEPRLCGHLVDGFIQDPLLKYNRKDVLQVLEHEKIVDVAKTKERFGNAVGVSEPLFIVSKRFTEWLMTSDRKLRWKPVELISDN
jgi:hypothetical protein